MNSQSMDNMYTCPICFNFIQDGHITSCGHSFCYNCITQTFEQSKRCPICNTVLLKDHIIPNLMLNEIVQKFKLEKELETRIREGNFHQDNLIKEAISQTTRNLSLADIEHLLQMLNEKKLEMQIESDAIQNKLLLAFLNHLLRGKVEVHKQIQKQIIQIEEDINLIKTFLDVSIENSALNDNLTSSTSHEDLVEQDEPEQQSLEEAETSEKVPTIEQSMSILAGFNKPVQTKTFARFILRKKRIFSHFEDFARIYFECRERCVDPIVNVDQTKNSSELSEIDPGLDNFRESLVKFSKYTDLRCLATLSYSNDFNLASTIVSSVEFDKDNEYFAVAGVTKRIKIFDFYSAIRDANVDIKYPVYEMQCNSKISCVSWNNFLKEILASSDYEGIVTIWDVQTGTRKQTLQEHDKRCWSVDFNEIDTRLLVSGSDDARVKFWSLNCSHSISTLEAKANVCCVKFNPASSTHLAIGSADHNVHYYDLRQMREPLCMFKGHKKAVSYVKFLNSNELVSAGTDGQLKLWDITQSGPCKRSFFGHINEKNFVGLATNGNSYIACGSEDNSLSLYYKNLPTQLFSYKFTNTDFTNGYETNNTNDSEFVSAVCWRRTNDVLMAGNSKGIIKILELY
uniref:CSON013668 protein n=1 Tax=Culicoides sonorensis TaxID=179676 RepID=A0A336LHD4_CULSO